MLLEHSGRFLGLNYAAGDDYRLAGGGGSRVAASAGLGNTQHTSGMSGARAVSSGRYLSQAQVSQGENPVEIMIWDP